VIGKLCTPQAVAPCTSSNPLASNVDKPTHMQSHLHAQYAHTREPDRLQQGPYALDIPSARCGTPLTRPGRPSQGSYKPTNTPLKDQRVNGSHRFFKAADRPRTVTRPNKLTQRRQLDTDISYTTQTYYTQLARARKAWPPTLPPSCLWAPLPPNTYVPSFHKTAAPLPSLPFLLRRDTHTRPTLLNPQAPAPLLLRCILPHPPMSPVSRIGLHTPFPLPPQSLLNPTPCSTHDLEHPLALRCILVFMRVKQLLQRLTVPRMYRIHRSIASLLTRLTGVIPLNCTALLTPIPTAASG
jgi:hypothetical protein